MMFRHAKSAALIALLVVSGCSSGGTIKSPSAAIAVSGGTGCTAEHIQDLMFSGALTGHLVCARDRPICNFVYANKPTEHAFTAAIDAIADGKPLLITFGIAPFGGPGNYVTDNLEGGTTITLDGSTLWVGRVGDSITVTSADQHLLKGSLDTTLIDSKARTVRLFGRWVCDRVSSAR